MVKPIRKNIIDFLAPTTYSSMSRIEWQNMLKNSPKFSLAGKSGVRKAAKK